MKTKKNIVIMIFSWVIFFTAAAPFAAAASQPLEFACSAQVYEALGEKVIAAFTAETGIKVNLYVSSSQTAISRVENNFAELATSTTRLYRQHSDYGYTEILFARDPMVVFTNSDNGVTSLTKSEIQSIFTGDVSNWKDFGGTDQLIVTIIPSKQTGSYKNFKTLFMDGRDISYDFMAYKSSMVIEAARRMPYMISFITRAAVANDPKIKILSVDGASPASSDYPYFETFSFVTKGEPAGAAKKFIDFIMTGKGRAMLENKGLEMIDGK